jgi:bifunctional ADP-heptose synthase (sugar kinase/adenylyltransferase)
MLTDKLIRMIIDKGKQNGAYIAVDPKELHFFDFRGADLFKPNLREASQAAQKNLLMEDLSVLGSQWRKSMKLPCLAITMGANGIFLQDQDNEAVMNPDRNIDVIDVCGAGDAVVCSLALSLIAGLDLKKSGYLANLTGAYVCSHSGVVVADPEAIKEWL